jgi:ferredoxin
MSHVVCYFSGTGNCLHLAERLANALGDATVIPMGQGKMPDLGEVETVGFVHPSYFGDVPDAVRRFVAAVDGAALAGKYVYDITACGALAGNSADTVAGLLRAGGGHLDYHKSVVMFSNYVVGYDMAKDVAGITAKSETRIDNVVSAVLARRSNCLRGVAGQLAKPLSAVARRAFNVYERIGKADEPMAGRDRNFTVSDACISCGLCVRVCPVGNVELVEGRPAWQHRCEHCLACLQYCPARAIDYADRTQRRGRYHHPQVPAPKLAKANWATP